MKVAIYARVANEDQTALSHQENSLRLWAAEQGHEVMDVFYDMAPGTSLDRPGLQAMIRGLDAGCFEGVAVHSFDRLVRGTDLIPPLAEKFQSLGVKLVFPHELGDMFATSEMVLNALKKDYDAWPWDKVSKNR